MPAWFGLSYVRHLFCSISIGGLKRGKTDTPRFIGRLVLCFGGKTLYQPDSGKCIRKLAVQDEHNLLIYQFSTRTEDRCLILEYRRPYPAPELTLSQFVHSRPEDIAEFRAATQHLAGLMGIGLEDKLCAFLRPSDTVPLPYFHNACLKGIRHAALYHDACGAKRFA